MLAIFLFVKIVNGIKILAKILTCPDLSRFTNRFRQKNNETFLDVKFFSKNVSNVTISNSLKKIKIKNNFQKFSTST